MNNVFVLPLAYKVQKCYMNWSGGKDSAMALYKIMQQKNYSVNCMLTCLNAVHKRVSMHGVRCEMLQPQCTAIGLPLTTIELPEQPTMSEYDLLLQQKVSALKQAGFTHSIFGDIFLEDLKKYREAKLLAAGMQGMFLLWKIDTTKLIQEFIDLGFKTIIVCVGHL